jgi:DNA ligase (NAD+)
MHDPPTRFAQVDSLSEREAREQAEALREALEHHNTLYYVKNAPKISDHAYDALFRRLEELEEAFPELQTPASPTRRVGAPPVDALEKVEHRRPLLSLSSSEQRGKVEEFLRYVRENTGSRDPMYVLEPKLDGFSVEVIYREGFFERGATRGDGRVGEDISENLKTVRTLPLRLQAAEGRAAAPGLLAVRAEVLMSRSGFRELNRRRLEQGEEPFANPRNAAAGMMRQLDSRKVAGKPLETFFYDILDQEGGERPDSHWQVLERFGRWGLRTNPMNRRASSMREIAEYHRELSGQREELEYEIDGIVIKLDDRRQREELGTRQRSPRWAFAWKFPPKKEITTLREIAVSVGRTGILTTVALLDPVEVGGVTVSRATLHNEEEVERKGVRAGDKVRVMRAGDVIPEIAERVEKGHGRAFSMPSDCPACGTPVVREGAYVLCPAGLTCPAQRVGRITHFASRDAMNIRTLVDRGLIEDLPDLYSLSVEELEELEGFAAKSARKLHDAIQGSKQPSLERFLYALGIRHVGEHVASVLARSFGSLERLEEASREELEEVGEIGPEIAEAVHDFFQQKENRRVLERLREAGVRPQARKRPAQQPLKGLTFVFTGELERYTRDEAREAVELLGGRATSSVSGNTDYLVVGQEPGSKLDEARKRGLEVLDEAAFRRLLAEKTPRGK